MKSKIILTCAVVALALSLFACSSEVAVNVSASYDGKEVEITTGDALIITLESNSTTGFKWQYEEEVKDRLHILTGIPDETVLALIDHKFVQKLVVPEAGAPSGTGGEEVWTFKAVGKGTTELSLEYSQPWKRGIKAAETFSLTVIVK